MLYEVITPYDMYLAKLERLGITQPLGKYTQYYFEQGGTEHKLTNDDYRLLVDSVAYYCIENGRITSYNVCYTKLLRS